MKTCPKCNTNHIKPGVFCSRTCANSRQHSIDTKNKISNTIKTSHKYLSHTKAFNSNKIKKSCVICNSIYHVYPSINQKTCSKTCGYKLISKTNKGNTGGYREHSGRSKTGYYNNIYCGSTYELIWIMYNIYHNIDFKRFDGYILYNDNKKYFPDFIIGNLIIEIKGYHTPIVDIKCQAAIDAGYQIKVLYKSDIQYMFDWFTNKYPNTKLESFFE